MLRFRIALVGLLGLMVTSQVLAGDWPQWRGPDRSGAMASSVELADTWPEDGPPLLWQSQPIPSRGEGGYGSPVIAGGRVYLFVAWGYREPLPDRQLDRRSAEKLGHYDPAIPQDLVQKIEAARISEARQKLEKKQVNGWADKWMEQNLTEEQRKQFGRFAKDRLRSGNDAWPLDALDKVHAIVDQKMSPEAFDRWLSGSGLSEEQQKQVRKEVPTEVRKANDTIVCLDLADGGVIWKKAYPGQPRGHGSSSTPCIAEGRLYVGGSAGMLYCLDAKSGEEVWTQQLKTGEINSSFVVAEGLAIVQADELMALDAKTGEVRWRQDKVKHRHTSPVLWQHEGRQFLLCNTGKLSLVALSTGEIRWQVPGGGDSTPAVSGDVAAVLSNSKDEPGLLVYRITPEKAEQIAAEDVRSRGSSPVATAARVFAAAEGRGLCVDASTGKLIWQDRVPKDSFSSPLVVGSRLVVAAGGRLSLIDATGDAFREVAKARCPILTCTSPAFAAGRLVIRGKDALYCYDLRAEAGDRPAN